jgi:chaperone modulatory protein CbpM
MTSPTHHLLTIRPGMALEPFALRCGLHPDIVRRLVALGLIDARRDSSGDLVFEPSAVAVVARIRRLKSGLGLNYAAIALVLDLLDRIAKLENASPGRRNASWTRTA